MDVINISIAIIGTINFILGFLIYLRSRWSKINISYLILAISISSWCFTMFFFRNSTIENTAELWCRLLYASAALIPASFLFFVYLFPKGDFKGLAKKIFSLFSLILILALSLYPGVIIESVKFVQYGEPHIIFKYPFYFLYIFYIIFFFGWSFLVIFKKIFESAEIEKKQIKFLFFGTLASTGVGVITNLILPTFKIFVFNWLGQIFTIIMVVFIFYAIIKYRLLNVKIIATEIFLVLINITLLADLLLSKTMSEKIVKLTVFLLMLFFSYLLLKSIFKEIRTKEQLQKTAEELKRANKELTQLDKTKSEFMSIASHQLLTPLTPIRGYSSMLLEGEYGKVAAKQKKVLQMIYDSSVRLIGLAGDLLDISRIERNVIQYNFTFCDICGIISSVVEELARRAEEKKLKLVFDCDQKELFLAKADEGKIREIVFNLVDNAIKYSFSGKIKIEAAKKDGEIIVSVKDRGIGISKKDISKLFKKFSRSDDVKTINVEGTGLGLYVAKKYIEAHKGRIWVESAGKGKGSAFYFSLKAGKRER